MDRCGMNDRDLYILLCSQAAKKPKDKETIDFLVNTASRKMKDKYSWVTPQLDIVPVVQIIRTKAIEALQSVDLTVDQLLKIIAINPGNNEELRVYISDFLLSHKDGILQEALVQGCNCKQEEVRLGVMRLMVDLQREKRLRTLIPELINTISSDAGLTEKEAVLFNSMLGRNPSMENYKVLVQLPEVNGVNNLFTLISGLQGGSFSLTGGLPGKVNKKIKACSPLPDDSPEQFTNMVANNNVPKKRLAELAFFAPQWKSFIAYSFGKDRFVEAVDWFSDYSKSHLYLLLRPDIADGKINEIYLNLGDEIWKLLFDAASVLLNHRMLAKLRVYTGALIGKITPEEFMRTFRELDLENHWYARDYMEAIGIIPLKPEPDRDEDIVNRFQFIKEYIRQSKQFGEKRRTGNEEAGSVALSNLACNAGYSNIKNFEIAIEAKAVKDLAAGPVVTKIDDYELTLSLTDQGRPILTICKKGKFIKSIPEKLKSDENVIALKRRVKEIRHQVSRLRVFLEEAMCNSEEYSTHEFMGLMSHPILKAMMQKLIFVTNNGMGYPVGTTLRLSSYDRKDIRVSKNGKLRIAHPIDLLQAGDWEKWQHECFVNSRVQPFKQVFREVYIITDAEKNTEHESGRFAGQIIVSTQALVLFAARGWSGSYREEASLEPWKYHPSQRIWALCNSILPKFGLKYARIGTISFSSFEYKIPLENIPPVIFSETMRDIDLIVSVAHAKEGPWESSTSTVESRAVLVRETAQLLRLGNVRIEDSFAMVDGTLASYKVHLGSGSIHQVPGNYVCVIPDNTKFQGKLFLPFIDKDEMTSIILSKIILLAHDEKIKDPVILNQIKRSTKD